MILPDLSRSFKSKRFLPQNDDDRYPCVDGDPCRKRKRPSKHLHGHDAPNENTIKINNRDDATCFEIRQTKSKGIGMFATRRISCGDIIIAHEDPIVHCLVTDNIDSRSPFCGTCAAPVGTLRNHHIVAPPSASSSCASSEGEVRLLLPCFKQTDEEQDDLVFTSAHSTCKACNRVVWCSDECRKKGESHHLFVCSLTSSDSAMNKFLGEHKNNGMIFRLAIEAVTLALAKYKSLAKEAEGNSFIPSEQFFWWKDYGSHPLWWEVGPSDSKHDKTQATNDFCSALQSALSKSNKNTEKLKNDCENSATGSSTIIPEKVIRQICSLDNIGSLLGMLQCNVMEFQYPSPLQQYMEHVEEFLSMHDEDNVEQIEKSHAFDNSNRDDMKSTEDLVDANEEEKSYVLALKAGRQWLMESIRNSHRSNNNDDDDDDDKNNSIDNNHFDSTPNDGNCTKQAEYNIHQTQRPSATSVLGSGLYPLLTLANHDCHPNASIELLLESCRASMVALRDIEIGEEICITYVPNGGRGGSDDDNGEYFRHFAPTRTWKWLNSNCDDGCSSDGDDYNNYDDGRDSDSVIASMDGTGDNENDCMRLEDAEDDFSNDKVEDSDDDSGGNTISKVDEIDNPGDDDEEEVLAEGLDEKDRAKALSEYGFQCECNRCLHERENITRKEPF